MTLIEAAEQAADTLEIGLAYPGMRFYHDKIRAALTALRTAIEQAEKQGQCKEHGECFGGKCIYTTPPAAQRQWVGLTDTQIERVYFETVKKHRGAPMPWGQVQFGKALEAKLKEKNT
jgi:hypothetical protein